MFGIHYLGAQHTDWVRYGKVALEFFQGSVSSDTSLLNMLIHVDKHLELLGTSRLASTLVVAATAVVANLAPTLPVAALDEGFIDATLEMDLDIPISLSEHKCPRVLHWQAPTLQQLGGCTPSCAATTRSRPKSSVTTESYSS